jgi:hypothetical protein
MKASEYGVKNLKRVMANLRQWTRQDNDQYEDLQTIYQQVLNQFGRYQGHVMKNIGTRYQNNMPGTEPVENVPVALQREAISYLGRHIFDAPEWLYPADIINKVEINPTVHQNSRQEAAIERLLSASLLFSIYGQSATGSEAYPLDQYLDDVFATVWTPLGNADDWKTRERRNLQRCYVDQLNRLINPTGSNQQGSRTDNSDVLLYVLLHLDKVENYLKSQQAQGLNALHYQDLQERVQLIRERRKSPVQPVR